MIGTFSVAGSLRCEARVSLFDLDPTRINIGDLPPRTDPEGRSLLPLIANPDARWDKAVVSNI